MQHACCSIDLEISKTFRTKQIISPCINLGVPIFSHWIFTFLSWWWNASSQRQLWDYSVLYIKHIIQLHHPYTWISECCSYLFYNTNIFILPYLSNLIYPLIYVKQIFWKSCFWATPFQSCCWVPRPAGFKEAAQAVLDTQKAPLKDARAALQKVIDSDQARPPLELCGSPPAV